MALDLTQTWAGRNFEKVVLLAAAVVLAGAIALFVALRKPQSGLLGEIQTTITQIEQKGKDSSLVNVLSKDELIAFADLLTEKERQRVSETLSPEDRAKLERAAQPFTAKEFFDDLEALPPPWPTDRDPFAALPVKEGPVVGPTIIPALPAHVLPVDSIEAAVGRGVTKESVPSSVATMPGKGLSDILWVSLAGKFDLTAQAELNRDGHSQQTRIIVTNVALQRRTRTPDGWSDWQDVPAAVPDALRDKLPPTPKNPRDSREVSNWYTALSNLQQAIRRPPFFKLLAAEGKTIFNISDPSLPVEQPPEPSAAPPTAPPMGVKPGPAAPAPAPVPSPWLPGGAIEPAVSPAGAPAMPTPSFIEPQHVYATVWASDLSVQPGQTYQYRMRVSIFNPICGQEGAEDPKDAWLLTLPGEWSEPGPVVSIPPLIEYYFVGSYGAKANLELQRWIHGQWVIAPSVPIAIGAPVVHQRRQESLYVPGTPGDKVTETVDLTPGVVLVDLIGNFPYRPPGNNNVIRTKVLVVSDLLGDLHRRIEYADRNDAAKNRIERQGGVPPVPKLPDYMPLGRR